jgi:hypothetical protein
MADLAGALAKSFYLEFSFDIGMMTLYDSTS